MGLFQSAYVIARRDFVATVFSKTFVLFLIGPLLVIGISLLFGNVSEKMAREDLRPTVAVIASQAEFAEIETARARLNPAFGDKDLPDLIFAEPDYVLEVQVKDLLASNSQRIHATLTGGIAHPTLTGAITEDSVIPRHMKLILDEARQQRALGKAGIAVPDPKIQLVKVEDSAGSLASTRAITARIGQFALFMLTIFLASMLLSNLVEEKTNKVIEVLAAALPVDAIFLGKLFAMLAISLVGISVWTAGTLIGLQIWPMGDGSFPEPAVGWPLFVILTLIYYSANYLLLGALFLGIGSQASSVREVQTLSMPVTMGQLLIFLLASFAVGPFNSLLGIGAAIFPFSSPMAMVARAAQAPELWPHLLAIAWQLLWAWLTVKLAASLFRHNVMKSGSGSSARFGPAPKA